MIRWGTTMHLISDTPITSPYYVKSLGLKYNTNEPVSGGGDADAPYNWRSDANPSLTLKERLRRRLELHEMSVKCGYPQPRIKDELTTILELTKFIT